MSATPSNRIEYCAGCPPFNAPPGKFLTVNSPLNSSVGLSPNGVIRPAFTGCFGPIKYASDSSSAAAETDSPMPITITAAAAILVIRGIFFCSLNVLCTCGPRPYSFAHPAQNLDLRGPKHPLDKGSMYT